MWLQFLSVLIIYLMASENFAVAMVTQKDTASNK